MAGDFSRTLYIVEREMPLAPVLYNYALCYGAAHWQDVSSEVGAWPFIALGLGDKLDAVS